MGQMIMHFTSQIIVAKELEAYSLINIKNSHGYSDRKAMFRILLLLTLVIPLNLWAEEAAVICPIYHYKSVKKIAESSGQYDKFKHCAVSCLLTLRCPAVDVLEIGILKELADVVGPGNAELDDLKANFDGVDLVVKKKVKTDKACLAGCHKLYPANSCQ